MTAVGLVLLSVGLIVCWFAAADARNTEPAALPAPLLRFGRHIALLGGALQLLLAARLLGPATGPLLVLMAWMTMGTVFVLFVNAWPRLTSRAGLAASAAGALLLILI
jgi:hypothetical protein